jgi:uncharacterized RDD family membrane protein YckC
VSQKTRSAGQGRRPPATPRVTRQANATRLAAAPKAASADNTPDYPGKRFGLPKEGPMSVAPMGRRLAALLVDWLLCELIVTLITRHNLTKGASDPRYFTTQLWTLVLFAAVVYVFTAISGLTIGKRLLGIRVIRTDGGRPGFRWAAVRTVLLLFVVPALLSDRDLRGLHDRASDTIVVRL